MIPHLLALVCVLTIGDAPQPSIALQYLGTYAAGRLNQRGAEIAAYDAATRRLFITNARRGVDALDISDLRRPRRLFTLELKGVNSIAARDGRIAVAVESRPEQDPGSVRFYDTGGRFLRSLPVGPLPDMLTFTPDGRAVVVANEGEPNDAYTVDPEGSVSIIDLSDGVEAARVRTADFRAFNDRADALRSAGVRIFGPGATAAEDFEPEFIAVSPDSRTAFVVLQENNALALVDLPSATVKEVVPFGCKDHRLVGQGLDASDKDGRVDIRPWPVFGMYQPDGLVAHEHAGQVLLITANEGDRRDGEGFNEVQRVSELQNLCGPGDAMDRDVFPRAASLREKENLGRLQVTRVQGDTDGDGDFDALYTFGARSFSIWKLDEAGRLKRLYDSGDRIERLIAERAPDCFNADFDRSSSRDDGGNTHGPEPEGLALAEIAGRWILFVGLERPSGVMMWDITDPLAPRFLDYVNRRNCEVDFGGDADGDGVWDNIDEWGDFSPEGLLVIPADQSPIDRPLLVVCHEMSGTTTIFAISVVDENAKAKAE